jgi:hypothetical protein
MKLEIFQSDEINEIGSEVIRLDDEYRKLLDIAEEKVTLAFETRWKQGKLISENIDIIKEECGSQKNFAESIGKSEGMISNNKRAYETLKNDYNCDTWNDVVKLVKKRNIPLNSRSFEKIGTLLNEPTSETKQIDQIDKDLKRLEQLRAEADEILRRIEPAKKPDVYEHAFDLTEELSELNDYVINFDIEKRKWSNEKYLKFVRNFGVDLITMEPCESCDPHHTTITGGSGSMGEKLPDYLTIPVSRMTHMMIEGGLKNPSELEIAKALITTMSTFISMNLK